MLFRLATQTDVPIIHALIQDYVKDGTLLPRTMESLYRSLPSLVVAVTDNQLAGVVALHRLEERVAEVRTLTVAKGYQGQGIGQSLVQYAINIAETAGYHKVISFTTQTEFFARCGFSIIARDKVPTKYFLDCIHCSKLFRCDETAMERVLVASAIDYMAPVQMAKNHSKLGETHIFRFSDSMAECEAEAAQD